MKNKIILTDADGVLVNWGKAFDQFMIDRGYTQLPNTDHEYGMDVRFGVDHQTAHRLIDEFNNSEQIAHLEEFADSKKYIGKLVELGFRFIVVTSISNSQNASKNRTQNLESIFGKIFDEIHCIGMGESKSYILEKHWGGSDLFWIEDHPRQALSGHEAGLKTVLIDHPHNCHFQTDLFPRVSYHEPWKEIYSLVCREYGLVEV